MINTYAKYFKENVEYCSDSNGYWRYKRLEDFLNLFEQYQKDEFINYELIEAIGYIGIMRQLDDDIIEKRMKEILQNLEKKGYAKYRIYD